MPAPREHHHAGISPPEDQTPPTGLEAGAPSHLADLPELCALQPEEGRGEGGWSLFFLFPACEYKTRMFNLSFELRSKWQQACRIIFLAQSRKSPGLKFTVYTKQLNVPSRRERLCGRTEKTVPGPFLDRAPYSLHSTANHAIITLFCPER